MRIVTAVLGGRTFRIKTGFPASITGIMFDRMTNHDGALISSNAIGMLFVPRDLDLFFLDANNRIVDIQRAAPMTWRPRTWKSYRCASAVRCLEIKSGVARAKKGGRVVIIQ